MADKDKDKDKAATSKKKGDKKVKKPTTTKKDEKSPAKDYKPREPKGKKPSKKSKSKTSESKTKKPEDETKSTPEDEAKSKKKHVKLVREGKRLIEKEEGKEKTKEEVKEKEKEPGKDKEKEVKAKVKPKVNKPLTLLQIRNKAIKYKNERLKALKKEIYPGLYKDKSKDKSKNKSKDKGKGKGKDKGKDKEEDKDKDKAKARDKGKDKDNVISKEILEEGKEADQYKDIRKKKDDPEKVESVSKVKSLKTDTELKKESKEESGHNKDLIDTVFHKMEVVKDPKELKIKQEPETLIEIKYNKFEDIEENVKAKEKDILELMHKVFQWFKPDEVMMSFNGGKDCTVVLHMLNKFFQSNSCLKHIKIPALYITDPDGFEEIDQFVDDCKELFNIELIKKKGPIKEALTAVCNENKKLKAVFMGCRRTDPYCQNLKVTQMTDPGWPPLMRINPIIDWKCRQVWEYIYLYNVPYCILYQKGYTSIGNKKNTKPNPHLRLIDIKTGKVLDYRPGHEMIDNDELERAGRF